jgi:DNA polymerase delta subunit 3
MDSKLYLAENVLNERRAVCSSYNLLTNKSLPKSGHLSLIEPRAQSARQPGQTVCLGFATKIATWIGTDIFKYRVLYEFHRNENAKKPATVHATYIISGIQKAPEPAPTNGHANDEDEMMQSSPYLPSSMPNEDEASDSIRTASIILVREEDLEGSLLWASR